MVLLSVTPEKHALLADVAGATAQQFWGQAAQSPTACDAVGVLAPGTPAPLPLLGPQPLSRPQLLIAAQSASPPGAPPVVGLPSFVTSEGGVVGGPWARGRLRLHGGHATMRSIPMVLLDGCRPDRHWTCVLSLNVVLWSHLCLCPDGW